MAEWCEQCPNRAIAELAESVGAEEVAKRIRERGCNNWKRLEYEVKDKSTGQPVETKIRAACMRDHLPAWFNAVHALAAESCETAQTHRNVVAEGFSALSGRPVRGDFQSLPGEIRAGLLGNGDIDGQSGDPKLASDDFSDDVDSGADGDVYAGVEDDLITDNV